MEKMIIGDGNAANYLCVTKRTIINWRNNGIIPFKKIGDKIYYNIDNLDELVGKNNSEENDKTKI
jgi:Helix-turn-helix domain